MGRNKGTFEYSANLEGIVEGPIDAKQVVQYKADLILPATWEDGASAVWLYNGMMVAVGEDPITPNNGIYVLLDKTTYTNPDSWLQVNNPLQNIETAPRTIYCDPAGSDTTGDGSVGNPFRQPKRAFEDIGTILFTEITVQLNAGSYDWDADTATALQNRTVVNGLIEIAGEYTVIHAGVIWAATSPNGMLYNVTATGVTVLADDLVGLFVNDNGKPHPISYNSAGTTNFDVEASRSNRNGTKDIVQHATIINAVGEYVFDITYYNDVSSELVIKDCRINQDGANNLHLEFGKTSMQFQQCHVNVPEGMIIGQFSMSWARQFFRFDRCYLVHAGTDQRLLSIRRTMLFINCSRTVFDDTNNPHSHVGAILADGKNLVLTLLDCILRGPGNNAGIDGANYLLDTSVGVVFRDFDAAIRPYRGQKNIVNFVTQNPTTPWYLENVPYLFDYYQEDLAFFADIQKWVGQVGMFGDIDRPVLIAPQDKVNIQIEPAATHFPEITRGEAQLDIPVNTTTWITVGDFTKNHMVEVTFSGKRSVNGFAGKEVMQVNNGVLVSNTIYFQIALAPGVTISSQLSGNNIQIGVVVDNSLPADLVDFMYHVQRTLQPN